MLFKIKTMSPHAINFYVFNGFDIHVYHFVYITFSRYSSVTG
ncbi:hypothetical protein SAMN05216518_11754 [Bacteroidales bacterium KHT7]|nr:hypothetical protein SAMN05216518_11754 [Bacteroidales bacterium KHT7]